jgi:hypothetical protein
MNYYLVGMVCQLQGMAGVTLLGTALLAALGAEVISLFEAVTGRRLATVPAIGVDLILQLLDSFRKSIYLKGQGFDQGNNRIGSLIVDS